MNKPYIHMELHSILHPAKGIAIDIINGETIPSNTGKFIIKRAYQIGHYGGKINVVVCQNWASFYATKHLNHLFPRPHREY